ncbi:MAG: ABC transporter ATP-binding protein [Methylobacter sp.]|uniref:ABC transporter ATP-binding protein n=1 Tax=Methylicorpusculum sp. TaxID=2713644 RepID=UPI002730C234|nr:ABC transporter ATP-binding protein [Methylicorpusculum sp.]MDP2429663.1 ABC transporter ATP-binding protein [Methylobacter sp.]MDP2177504.1 ABC transporter ATP-binding protein [Methylicorpusculum sp.]MDP3055849.1 ABC transporter ATP-binding protein [Methylobacter sp.]MDP3362227.1 ABC transporter ATP-binding protein [Methylobacter sp.]MDZ4218343.1 ABC transporter ATP-binding protein [Methylobacter sp.]
MTNPLLAVERLSVTFNHRHTVVDEVSFVIYPGETFALVGESGSGKSITALSVLRLLPNNARLSADNISLNGDNLLSRSESDLCRIRGSRIGLVFQDPMSSLNPVMTIGSQIEEVINVHFQLPKQAVKQRVLELLRQVEIPEPQLRMKDYPHQLSGGQRQRVMIAIALAGRPDLLIADEPTTSLDVTIQAQILALLKTIQQQTGMALWLISHDLALVSTMADRVAVMQQGKIVETGKTADFFSNPQHPYTRKLLQALPSMDSCLAHAVEEKPPLLCVRDFSCHYPIRKGIFKRIVGYVRAVDGVSFDIQQGKTLALVGESGCGKTTLGKSLLNLIPASGGQVKINGVDLSQLSGEPLRQQRANIQIVFQDPFSSMNPRMLVGDIIAEGLSALHPGIGLDERKARVRQLLQQVDLPEDSAQRYPHEFSGGQRQRICIARALAVEPKLIVCDEPTSALDVSVQAQIIQLLKTLQQEKGVSYLFITHDLAVVAEIADDVAVMYQGKIIEQGRVEQVLTRPEQAYTKKLLAAVPVLKSDN